MTTYYVRWEMDDVETGSPREAAQYARDAQLRKTTMAVVFDVTDVATGETTRVDLLNEDGSDDYVLFRGDTGEFPPCADHGGPPHRHDSDGEPSI